MANLTITVDEESLRRARIRALELGTSVNVVLGEYLENFAGRKKAQQQAIRKVLALSKGTSSGSGGKKWTRDELYDR